MTATSYDTIKLAISGPEPVITTDVVNNLGRPSLVARMAQSEALLVRASQFRLISEWHGREQALVTHNGRLIQTAGVPENGDLIAPLLPNDPFLGDLRQADGVEVTRLIDMPDRYLTGVPQQARYRVREIETIEVMGEERQLQRVEEAIRMPALGIRETNLYWVDPDTGRVIASRQFLVPELPPLFLTEVAPAGDQP
ncbi:YjbF family lipoprotein [Halopseudomonas sp.]|uniref:YjbF family lipoprotein n=1 Tax=Halopseudomonas sp. TaxID=2901191 RepID=UPI003002E801